MSRHKNAERNVNVTTPTEGEWKGAPSLSLPTDNPKYPVTMCLPKWRIIVKHMDAVKAFVEKHSQPDEVSEKAAATMAKVLNIPIEKAREMLAAA